MDQARCPKSSLISDTILREDHPRRSDSSLVEVYYQQLVASRWLESAVGQHSMGCALFSPHSDSIVAVFGAMVLRWGKDSDFTSLDCVDTMVVW